MKQFCLGLAGLIAFPVLSWADGTSASRYRDDCGGAAYSFAEVVSAPRSVEPLIAVPGTLCADLPNRHDIGINSLNIYIDPNRNAAPEPRPGGDTPMRNAPRRRP